MSALGEWVEEGLYLLTHRIPITVITWKALGERERNAFDLGCDAGPIRKDPTAPLAKVRHLQAVAATTAAQA